MAISRRALILSGLAASGGLAVWYATRRLDDGDAAANFAATTPGAVALNAWLKIDPDGTLILGVHRAEMGQGVTTSLPMLLAEELDADWRRVRFEFTPVDRDYYNFGVLLRGQPLGDVTGRPVAAFAERGIRGAFHAMGLSMTLSSTSMVDGWDTVRLAGATARALLVAAAARRWALPAAELSTSNGEVLHAATGRRAGYGELAALAAAESVPEVIERKEPSRFTLIGTSPPRLDVPAKVTGSARFGIDTALPGLLHATIRHSPLVGTRIAAIDNVAEVSSLPGVEGVVRVGRESVAVVAADSWSAQRAAARLSLKPEPVDAPVADDIALLEAWRRALDDPDPAVLREEGEWPVAGGTSFEAVYELPWLAHVCMEPMNCTALVAGGKVTVWAPTQAESVVRDVAAATAGVAPEHVTVHRMFLGGGFGRRTEMDFVIQAVTAAMAFPGRPVKLSWTRTEDIAGDCFRPGAVARLRAAMTSDRIASLDYTLATQSVTASYFERTPTPRGGDARSDTAALSGAINLAYTGIPALRFALVPQDPGVPAGFWRSVGNSHNCFILEGFIDELAHAAGADPVEFRLAHLDGKPAFQAVLRRAAERSGWGSPAAAGSGRGVALLESHDTIVALVAEVQTTPDGSWRVARMTCVADPRIVIHPDALTAQLESGILDGYGSALYGRLTFRGGMVEQRNFDSYRMLRLADTPIIDIELMPQGGRPGGAGEPGVPGVAPAIANALFAATGQRIRKLPLMDFKLESRGQ
ncbi:MAG: xanthine dehydrogenase family protein molybdopterin-binding subunit [Gammaproteobacteria bacterium]|nr:xanthine dehydrogenase family protein molybdopterin-binding subunit [Gammaproteobacteria bacterium]